MRQMQGGGGKGAMSFGKSKARMLTEDQIKTTFADVAGCDEAKEEVAETIKEEGERACMETGVIGLHPDIVNLLGKLKYRTSYGQNVLNHSIEVSNLARIMADELGLDPKLARS